MSAYQVIYVLMAHYISCFVFQSDIMASQKSNHFSWMVLHTVVYIFSLFFLMLLGMVLFDDWGWSMVWKFTLINMVTYFIIDLIASRINADSKEMKQYYLLSIGMGLEQLLHASILVLSLSYLMSS